MKRLVWFIFLGLFPAHSISQDNSEVSTGDHIHTAGHHFADQTEVYWDDGNQLYAQLLECERLGLNVYTPLTKVQPGDESAFRRCRESQHYVWGSIDIMKNYITYDEWRVCIPHEVNGYQIFDVLLYWLKDNPEERHQAPIKSIRAAIQAAWPCA
jgi:hypothetical protein